MIDYILSDLWAHLVTCGHHLVTCGHHLVTCGHHLVTCGHHLVTCGSHLVTCGHHLVTCHDVVVMLFSTRQHVYTQLKFSVCSKVRTIVPLK